MKGRLWVGILLAALLPHDNAFSNDAAISNVGGTIHAMKEHPAIRLFAEHVHAYVYYDHVDVECVFVLCNRGRRTVAKMGFPDDSWNGRDHYSEFESYVDGVKADVKVSKPIIGVVELDYWWTKDVVFEPGQVRVVRDVYRGGIGKDVCGNHWFEYTLSTGASWSHTIGAASFVVTLDEEIKPEFINRISPPPTEVDGQEIRWVFTDFEPGEEDAPGFIIVRWMGPDDVLPRPEDIEDELRWMEQQSRREEALEMAMVEMRLAPRDRLAEERPVEMW